MVCLKDLIQDRLCPEDLDNPDSQADSPADSNPEDFQPDNQAVFQAAAQQVIIKEDFQVAARLNKDQGLAVMAQLKDPGPVGLDRERAADIKDSTRPHF